MFTSVITKTHLFTEKHNQKALKVTGTDTIVHPSSSNFLSNPLLKSIWSLKNTIKFPQMIKSLFIAYSFCCSAINSSVIYYYLMPLTLWQTASFPDGDYFFISTHCLHPHLSLTHTTGLSWGPPLPSRKAILKGSEDLSAAFIIPELCDHLSGTRMPRGLVTSGDAFRRD